MKQQESGETLRWGDAWDFFPWPQIMQTIHLPIQGVTGGTDQTSGECSLGQTILI